MPKARVYTGTVLGSGTFGIVLDASIAEELSTETEMYKQMSRTMDSAKRLSEAYPGLDLSCLSSKLAAASSVYVGKSRSVALKSILLDTTIRCHELKDCWETKSAAREADALLYGAQLPGSTVEINFRPFATEIPSGSTPAVAACSSRSTATGSQYTDLMGRKARVAVHMMTPKLHCSLSDALDLVRREQASLAVVKKPPASAARPSTGKRSRRRASRLGQQADCDTGKSSRAVLTADLRQVLACTHGPALHASSVLVSTLGTEHGKRAVAAQAIAAVATMHSTGVCHRDIKTNNILVDVVNVGSEDRPQYAPRVILADLGTAKAVGGSNKKGPGAGPHCCFIAHRQYRAPELLLGSTAYGLKADVFSLAAVLAELWLGEPLLRERKATLGGPVAEPDELTGDAVQLLARATLLGVPTPPEYEELLRMLDGGLADAAQAFFDAAGCSHQSERMPGRPTSSSGHRLPSSASSSSMASAQSGAAASSHVVAARPASLLVYYLSRRGVPADVSDCLASMMAWGPSCRASALGALEHPAWRGQQSL